MKLLREFYQLCENGFCVDLLSEDEKRDIKDNNAMYLTGKLSAADEENGNGRVYPFKVLQREVENYQKLIREKRSVGQLDHPDTEQIELKEASHLVTRTWWDGKTLMGSIKLLNTPNGKIAQQLVKDGVQLGISSRALGSLNESGGGPAVVQDDLQVICFDLVSEPSSVGAFMKPVSLHENKIPKIFTKADRINRKLRNIIEDI